MKQFNMSLGSDVVKAQRLFDRCIMLMSGLQQPPHSPDEKTAQANREAQATGEQELLETAVALFQGLTGKEVVIDIPDVDDAHGGRP